MSESLLRKLLYSAIVRLRPPNNDTPREIFQVRFFLSACLLAIVVGLLSLLAAVSTGQYISAVLIATFLAVMLLHLLVARLGFRAKPLMWSLLVSVTIFLVMSSLVTREVDPSQLCWLILIPLATRAFAAPQVEYDEPQDTSRRTLLASVMSVFAAFLIVILHDFGITFNQPFLPEPSWLIAANYPLFLASVVGLVLLYDFSAKLMIEELHRVRRLLSICAWCRKIKSDSDWMSLEEYTAQHTQSDLTHGICPECRDNEFQKAGL
jgi:hypothetical protein